LAQIIFFKKKLALQRRKGYSLFFWSRMRLKGKGNAG
jgi:hypothetical protein